MFSYSYFQRVRYADTDKMGYLYYGHYAKYYEIGRVETLRSLGLSYKAMEDELGIMLPVLSLEARYLQPAYYDDNIEIKTIIKNIPNKMIVFNHELFNDTGNLINKAEVKLFFVDMKSNKRVSCPEMLSQKLLPFFQ